MCYLEEVEARFKSIGMSQVDTVLLKELLQLVNVFVCRLQLFDFNSSYKCVLTERKTTWKIIHLSISEMSLCMVLDKILNIKWENIMSPLNTSSKMSIFGISNNINPSCNVVRTWQMFSFLRYFKRKL